MILVLLAGVVVIVVLATSAGAKALGPLPPEFAKFVKKKLGTATKADIDRAATAAEKAGFVDTAENLRKKSEALASLGQSPLPEANALGWRKFVQLMGSAPPGQISPQGYYGAFAFGAKRLSDLGLVKNVRPGTYAGKKVWTGDWVPPLTGAGFLSNYDLQYKAFVKSMNEFRNQWYKIGKSSPEVLNKIKVGTDSLTLSGFLGLAHRAGLSGAIAFLRDRTKRFPRTAAILRRTNGIF